jgi:hypothetical protein
MLAAYSEPSYPATLVGFRQHFVRDKFASFRLCESFFDSPLRGEVGSRSRDPGKGGPRSH